MRSVSISSRFEVDASQNERVSVSDENNFDPRSEADSNALQQAIDNGQVMRDDGDSPILLSTANSDRVFDANKLSELNAKYHGNPQSLKQDLILHVDQIPGVAQKSIEGFASAYGHVAGGGQLGTLSANIKRAYSVVTRPTIWPHVKEALRL